MISAYLERANSTDLTTLARVKEELQITLADDDEFLADLIKEASDVIRSLTNRNFQREKVTETMQGSARTLMLVRDRLPLKSISAIRFDGSALDTSEYAIWSEKSGQIFRNVGWNRASPATVALGTTILNMQAERLWEVDYTGGYLLPGDDQFNVTGIGADSTNDKFTDSASNFPLLVAGETFTISGFSDSSIDGTYTVSTRTASEIEVTESVPATESAGAAIDLTVRNLPYDIERVTKEAIKEMYVTRRRNPLVSEEEIGDAKVKYGKGSVSLSSLETSPIIKRWQLRF